MRRLFWFLILLIASVWIGLKISQDPGYALFAYRHWTMEMPLWFAIIAFFLFLFLFYGVLQFFDSIDFSIYRFKNWLRWRKKYKSYSKTNRGLIELIEGHWKSAEYLLTEGIDQSDAPLVNYLAAAIAAQEQQAYDRRDMFLRKAHQVSPQAEIAIGLTQARLQYEQGQLEQALATLDHLRSIAPKHAFVLKLLEKVYVRLADWKNLLKLLPALRKAKIITDDELQTFEKNTYRELLESAAHKNADAAAIQQIWESIPRKIQSHPEVLSAYVRIMLPHAEFSNELAALINKAMKKSYNKELVRLYGSLQTQDVKKQLSYAESWHKQYGNQSELLFTLGRLCAHAQLWGQARHYFEDCLKLQPAAEVYFEYGKLLEQLGETNAALHAYKQGLN